MMTIRTGGMTTERTTEGRRKANGTGCDVRASTLAVLGVQGHTVLRCSEQSVSNLGRKLLGAGRKVCIDIPGSPQVAACAGSLSTLRTSGATIPSMCRFFHLTTCRMMKGTGAGKSGVTETTTLRTTRRIRSARGLL